MTTSNETIQFSVELDQEDAQKELRKLSDSIKQLEKQLADSKAKKTFFAGLAESLGKELKAAQRKLDRMKLDSGDTTLSSSISAQMDSIKKLEAAWKNATTQSTQYENAVNKSEATLSKAKNEAGELAKKLTAAGPTLARLWASSENTDDTESKKIKNQDSGTVAKTAKKNAAALSSVQNRIMSLTASALAASAVTQMLTGIQNYAAKVISSNEDATAAVARLKGAFYTLAQPLMEVIVPAVVAVFNILAATVGQMAQVVASLFGTTTEQAAQAAAALNGEGKAMSGTGKAAQKAAKSMAAFDKINQLSAGGQAQASSGGGGISTSADFSWAEGMSETLKSIGNDVLLIGAGFALWSISEKMGGLLGSFAGTLSSIMITIGGVLLLWHGLADAWENGVDWTNLIAMIGGVAAAALGLYTVFGPMGAGIALVAGGIALMMTGFKDILENGPTLQNMLLSIAGIVATGLGFSLLTGSIIPLVIAGVATMILAFAAFTGNAEQLIENVKMIFSGLLTFIDGVFSGDMSKVFEGLRMMVTGLFNSILTIAGSLFNALIQGINWLIEKINSIQFTIPEWVPGIGGKSVGFNLPYGREWKIPQLATGAVIPPNREFMAILGDQTRGYNIEAPEDLIRKIVREESGGGMNTALLRSILDAIREGKVLTVDRDQFAKLVYSANKSESRRVGVSLAGR